MDHYDSPGSRPAEYSRSRSTSPKVEYFWPLLAVIFLILFILFANIDFLQTKNDEISVYGIMAVLFLNIFLLSYLKVITDSIGKEDDDKIQRENIRPTIEKSWKIFFFPIIIIIIVSIIRSPNSMIKIANLIFSYFLISILGIYIVFLPVGMNEAFKALRRKKLPSHKPIVNIIINAIAYFFILAYALCNNYLVFISLLFVFIIFPLYLCPLIIDSHLKLIYRLARGLNNYIELNDSVSKFRIDLRGRKKYELQDTRLFWHFFIGMFLFSIFCLIVFAANLELATRIDNLHLFLMNNSIFFVLLPLFAFIFLLSLLGFIWNGKDIKISNYLKYMTLFTIIISVIKIHEKNLLMDIFNNGSYLFSLVFGVSLGFTMFRIYLVSRIENYFSDPKFEKPLYYLEVLK